MRFIALVFINIFLTVCLANIAHATASLGFSPQRIVMKDRERSTSLTLTNRGTSAATFRISMADMIYQTDGSVKQTATPPAGYPTARNNIRFSPRQVRLAPGQTQRVRVLVRNAQTLADGEYRVHALMQQIAEPTNVSANKQNNENTIGGQISFNQAVAVPIIIRKGQGTVKAGIASANRQGNKLNLTVWRQGNQSAYANVEIYSGAVSEARKVTVVKGFAVPVPNTNRVLSLDTKKYKFKPPYILVLKDHDTGTVLDQKRVN